MGRGLRARRASVSVLLLKKVPRCLFESAPEEMGRTLAYFHERYGSARSYLKGVAGCSPDLLDRIAGRLQG